VWLVRARSSRSGAIRSSCVDFRSLACNVMTSWNGVVVSIWISVPGRASEYDGDRAREREHMIAAFIGPDVLSQFEEDRKARSSS
jgi:hypothetical protein